MTSKFLNIHCDGGARGNPGPAAIGFVVEDSSKRRIYEYGEGIGETTNNAAEYQAVVLALRWLSGYLHGRNTIDCLNFFLDSQLVVNQLNGNFKIKKPHLRQYHNQIKTLEKNLKIKVGYQYIPREQNTQADKLLNQALDNLK